MTAEIFLGAVRRSLLMLQAFSRVTPLMLSHRRQNGSFWFRSPCSVFARLSQVRVIWSFNHNSLRSPVPSPELNIDHQHPDQHPPKIGIRAFLSSLVPISFCFQGVGTSGQGRLHLVEQSLYLALIDQGHHD